MARYSSAVLWFGVLDCRLLRELSSGLFSACIGIWGCPQSRGLSEHTADTSLPCGVYACQIKAALKHPLLPRNLSRMRVIVHHLGLSAGTSPVSFKNSFLSFLFWSTPERTVFEDRSETLCFLPVHTYTALYFPCILRAAKLLSLKSAGTKWLYKVPLHWISDL